MEQIILNILALVIIMLVGAGFGVVFGVLVAERRLSKQQPEKPPEPTVLDPEIVFILARSRESAQPMGSVLLDAGLFEYVPRETYTEAQYKQAICTTWCLDMWKLYGDDWREQAGLHLDRLQAKVALMQSLQPEVEKSQPEPPEAE